ncbi:unnamed protein product [Protopolystoma xenopodis]|uniref:LRRCT domain-containing protein n=1 Tax=Protopolystoma xenopodis TaxID=117903 RepID=A0A3S5BNX0_9PLAT|nr:unnamed protein product [Protopolystoma xenopodis]
MPTRKDRFRPSAASGYISAGLVAVLVGGWWTAVTGTVVSLTSTDNYLPCEFTPGSGGELKNAGWRPARIMCNEKASANFGEHLPRLVVGGTEKGLIELVIKASPKLTTCSTGIFKDSRGQLHRLVIEGGRMHIFERACLEKLSQLQELVIRNAFRPSDAKVKKGSGSLVNRLFSNKFNYGELADLQSLLRLELENVELSSELPDGAFRGFSQRLERLRLAGNQLPSLDNRAFQHSRIGDSLRWLGLEYQPDGMQLLRNAKIWAEPFTRLTSISLDGNPLDSRGKSAKLDFGIKVNMRLVELSLQDCSIGDLPATGKPGLDLSPIGEQLRRLYLGGNPISSRGELDRKHRLSGLVRFSRLEHLQVNGVLPGLDDLPSCLTTSKSDSGMPSLRTLRIEHSGLRHLGPNSLPGQLLRLHLSANPLETVSPDWAVDGIFFQGRRAEVQLQELQLNEIRLASVQVGTYQGAWNRALLRLAGSLRTIGMNGCEITSEALKPIHHQTVTEDNGHAILNPLAKTGQEVEIEVVGATPTGSGTGLRLGLNQLTQLETILLARNQLTRIPKGAFARLTKLRILVLHSNRLESLSETTPSQADTKEGMVNDFEKSVDKLSQSLSRDGPLEHLDLSKNKLTTLERCAPSLGFSLPLEDLLPRVPKWLARSMHDRPLKARVGELGEDNEAKEDNQGDWPMWQGGLILRENQLECDCRLAWLRRFVNSMTERVRQQYKDESDGDRGGMRETPIGYQIYLKQAIDFPCHGSNRLTGRNFLSLSPEELDSLSEKCCPAGIKTCHISKPEVTCAQAEEGEEAEKLGPVSLLSVARYDEAANAVRLNVRLDEMTATWRRNREDPEIWHDSMMRELWTAIKARKSETSKGDIDSTGRNSSSGLIESAKAASHLDLTQYAFVVIYWPTGLPDRATHGDRLHNPPDPEAGDERTRVSHTDRDQKLLYSLFISPARSSTAYTICLREVKIQQITAYACQIMQPFNTFESPDDGQTEWPSIEKLLVGAGIGVAGFGLLALCCIVFICLCRRARKRRRAGQMGKPRYRQEKQRRHCSACCATNRYVQASASIPNVVVAPSEPLRFSRGPREGRRSEYNLPTPPPLPPPRPDTGDLSRSSLLARMDSGTEGVYSGLGDLPPEALYLEPRQVGAIISSDGRKIPLPDDRRQSAAIRPSSQRGKSVLQEKDEAGEKSWTIGKRISGDGQEQPAKMGCRCDEAGLALSADWKRKRFIEQRSLSQNDLADRAGQASSLRGLDRTGRLGCEDVLLLSNVDDAVAPTRNVLMRSWRKVKRLLTRRPQSPPPERQTTMQLLPPQPLGGLNTRYPSTPNLPMPFWLMPREDQLAASGMNADEIEVYMQGRRDRDEEDNYLGLQPTNGEDRDDEYLPMSSLSFRDKLANFSKDMKNEHFRSELTSPGHQDRTAKNNKGLVHDGQLRRKPSKSADLERRQRGHVPVQLGDLYEVNPYGVRSNSIRRAEQSSMNQDVKKCEESQAEIIESGRADSRPQAGTEATVTGRRILHNRPPKPKVRTPTQIKQTMHSGVEKMCYEDLPPPPPPPPPLKEALPFRLPPFPANRPIPLSSPVTQNKLHDKPISSKDDPISRHADR